MNSRRPSAAKKYQNQTQRVRNHLWLLDIAFFLLGGLLLILVLRLLRFDSPDILTNAWTYVLGVPTVLIGVAMLTHTLSNDVVERSIQVGFLSSVIVHLLITWGASHWVLFGGFGNLLSERGDLPADPSERIEPPVYFQPAPNLTTAERPDYMRPVPTESLMENTDSEVEQVAELKEASGASELEIDLAPEVNTELEKQVLLPERANFQVDEPEIQSSQQEAIRPEPVTGTPDSSELAGATVAEIPETSIQMEIDVPTPTPVQVDLQRSTDSTASPNAALNIESVASLVEATTSDSVASNSDIFNAAATDAGPLEASTIPHIDFSQSPLQLPAGRTAPASLEALANAMENDTRLSKSDLSAPQSLRPVASPQSSSPVASSGNVVPLETGAGVPRSEGPMASDSLTLENLTPLNTLSVERSDRTKGTSHSDALSLLGLQNLEPQTASPSPLRLADNPAAMQVGALALSGRPSELELPDLGRFDTEPLRFMRPDALGASGVSSSVPLPAPAFSQRIERIKEREQQANSSLGVLGPKTELAIELGLQFLADNQREDGSWSLTDYPEPTRMESRTAATALALLSFQGAGYTHKQFKYASVCKRALNYLIKSQRSNGDLYQRGDSVSDANAWIYSHAMAALALCEAYGMTQDEEIKVHAQLAIDFLVDSQDPAGGGWRYTPRIGSDTSVTGWVMMAFKSAELSGLNVPQNVYVGIERWMENSQAKDAPYLYRYNWQANTPTTEHGRNPTPVMTSVGLLIRLYTGWKRDHPHMDQGTTWLLRYPPAIGTPQSPSRDTYYWYYATQVMFHEGGEKWDRWYNGLYPILIDSQELSGDWMGSWDPAGPVPDAWGEFGGRLYVTTLNLLSLEVYYRHLPLYDATAK